MKDVEERAEFDSQMIESMRRLHEKIGLPFNVIAGESVNYSYSSAKQDCDAWRAFVLRN